MIRKLTLIASVLSLGAGSAAFAQNAGEASSSRTDLQVGEVVVEPTTTEHGDWAVICLKNDDGEENCYMQHLVLNDEATPIARIEVSKLLNDPERAAGSIIALPLGVLLQDGILIQVDQALPRRYQYAVCDATGCYARIAFTNAEITRMKAGNSMRMTIFAYANPDDPIELMVSLTGFTSAFESM